MLNAIKGEILRAKNALRMTGNGIPGGEGFRF